MINLRYVGLAALIANTLVLWAHNTLLPWLYLLAIVPYYFLHCRQNKKNIDYWSGLEAIFTKNNPAYLLIVLLPVLFTLYSLDFALLCGTILFNGIAVAIIQGGKYGKGILRSGR
jgi:hypothetical protein